MWKATLRPRFLSVLLTLIIAAMNVGATWAGDTEQLFIDFLKSPTKERYVAVYQALTTGQEYNPYGDDLKEIKRLIGKKHYEEARQKLKTAWPSLLLSPSAHQCAATVARTLGDEATADKERQIAEKCLQGILATGDGSRERPYLVSRVSDEYDLIRHLNKRSTTQGLSLDGQRSYDVLNLDDGSQMWFDISAVFARVKRGRQ